MAKPIFAIMPEIPNILLCLPVQWKYRSEIPDAIAVANAGEYTLTGNTLLHTATRDGFRLEVYPPDERLRTAFETTAQGRLSEADLSAISNHTFVIYLFGKGGSMEDAEKTMNAGNAIIKAGALSVKVETCGRAFNPGQWTAICNTGGIEKYYEAYVAMGLSENNAVYTCGMHNMGIRDIICEPGADINKDVELTSLFMCYLLFEKPLLTPGQTFRKNEESPAYTIIEEDCTMYMKSDLYFNPFGMYRLQPAFEV